ncbi:hypothetical protein DLM75_18875 [Leptospira stimsonii]|uniref:Uncharacterized protein n=1 Tax=Leptospira stimsonii TaxID=2202203 RepID=A0A396Z1K5_9LEPT|nr:hypothetical protein DLM75_18875 [Leptospira stimsonii]
MIRIYHRHLQEASILEKGKLIYYNYSTRSSGYGLGWMFNVFSLGFIRLYSTISAGARFRRQIDSQRQ